MSYPKTEAPYTEAGYVDSTPVVFNLEEKPDGILLSWTNPPFASDGSRPATMAAVGKEYGTVASPIQLTNAEMLASANVECHTQTVACIPHPAGRPPATEFSPDRCYSGIWDTPIAGASGMMQTPYVAVNEIFVPFNKFSVNACAVQTDGKESQYYVELTSVGGNILKTKWVFKYTSPNRPDDFLPCGATAPTTPPPVAPPTQPAPPADTKPGKGQGGGKK